MGIAMQEDLQYAESTIGNNGYPQSLRPCIYGFKDFAHYEEVRDKYDLQGIHLKWRDGQQLPNRNNNSVYEPYELISEDFGDSHCFWYKREAQNWFEMCIEDLWEFNDFLLKYNIKFKSFEQILNDLKNIEDRLDDDDWCIFENLVVVLKQRNEIYQKIINLKSDTQVVITEYGRLYDYDVETIVMQYRSDVWHYAIALEH
jgi:hypothetical protein